MISMIKAISQSKVPMPVCQIGKNLKDIVLKPKESSSPSEVVFAKLLGQINQKGEEKNIGLPIALKVWLNVSPKDKDSKKFIYETINNTYGLLYEASVYKHVINNILVNGRSPNFIGSLGYGECPMTDRDGNNLLNDIFTPEKAEKMMKSLEKSYTRGIWWRPNVKISLLLLEKIVGDEVMTLEVLQDRASRDDELKNNVFPQVMFQIIFSLAIMAEFELAHNDLHCGNILVVKHSKPVERYYKVGRQIYKIHTKYVPYIFDWDYAYCAYLGPNEKLNYLYCAQLNICNKFNPRADLYTLFCTMDHEYIAETYNVKATQFREGYFCDHYQKFEAQREMCEINEDEAKRLMNVPPFYNFIFEEKEILDKDPDAKKNIKKIYKLSKAQVKDIFNKEVQKKCFVPDILHVFVELIEKRDNDGNRIWFVQIPNYFECRGTVFTEDMPTARELLDHHYFLPLKVNNAKKGCQLFSTNG